MAFNDAGVKVSPRLLDHLNKAISREIQVSI